MIAIIIPTLNRPDFIIRQLQYYNETAKDITVYIGDGSTLESRTKVAKIINIFKNLQVVHLDCSGLNDRNTIFKLITTVKEPYCAYVGDDDYLIPSSLKLLAAFLDEHPDYRTAQGRGILFSTMNDNVYGDLVYCDNYWGVPESENQLPRDRLKEFGENYFVPLFSLHRTEEFIEDWVPFVDLSDRSFGELAPNFLTIVRGKSKFIDCLYLIRQNHKSRYHLPSGMDWLATPDWYPSYKVFENAITLAIVEIEGIHELVARQSVKEVMHSYFANHLAKHHIKKTDYFKNFLNLFKDYLPTPITDPSKYLLSRYSPDRKLTQHSLLRKSSPYHQVFISILRSVSGEYYFDL
jgi:glycosyltransferase domain-containing protein